MANKRDVANAFYEGVCVTLSIHAVHESIAYLEGIDLKEFGEYIDANPEYEKFRHFCDEAAYT